MTMTLIKGTFQIIKSQPDGDSVHFYPTDVDAFTKTHLRVDQNHAGGAQLRMDGIDALETHYTAPHGPQEHQLQAFAHGARDELLSFLGFTGVQRTEAHSPETVTAASPDQIPGYILTRFGDKYHRCVAFVFKGDLPHADLSQVSLTVALMQTSANYHLLTTGLAYPTYYSKLYVDLRKDMTKAVEAARTNGIGLWPQDKTTAGFTVTDMASVTDGAVIMPKLFRRVMNYLALNAGSMSMSGFKAYLASQDDRMYIISEAQSTGFDTILDVQGQTVKLTKPPEDLIFNEG